MKEDELEIPYWIRKLREIVSEIGTEKPQKTGNRNVDNNEHAKES